MFLNNSGDSPVPTAKHKHIVSERKVLLLFSAMALCVSAFSSASPAYAQEIVDSIPMATTGTENSLNGIAIPSLPTADISTDASRLIFEAQQSALQAQEAALRETVRMEQEHNKESFNRAAFSFMPLSNEQIRAFMKKYEANQKATQPPSTGNPKGQTKIQTISLDPGIDPPVVELNPGFITTITLVDVTGQPWPVLDVGVGGNFEVSPTRSGSHVIRIMPLTRVATGVLSIMLKELPTPVIMKLTSGGPRVDLRYDARIAKFGPGARPQIINRPRLQAGDEILSMILENVPPREAVRMNVGGLDNRTKAWMLNRKVYVRTPHSLLSPAWNSSVTSADGTTVYEIGSAPVLLMSDNGAIVRATISARADNDE